MSDATLEVRHLGVRYAGGRSALRDVDLEVARGEICALAGHNGSGKSSLIKVLAGHTQAVAGSQLRGFGRTVELPSEQRLLGSFPIGVVHQDLGVIETMTILENMRIMDMSKNWFGRVRWGRERAIVRESLSYLGVERDPDTKMAELGRNEQALVALGRALMKLSGEKEATKHAVDHGVLILDELTTWLEQTDIERVRAVMGGVTDRGGAVIFITHRIDEMLDLADRIVILRDGEIVADAPTGEMTEDRIITTIAGDQVPTPSSGDAPAARAGTAPCGSARSVLVAEGVSGGRSKGVSLEIREGEVLGVTGLGGSGFEDIPYLLGGATPAESGTLRLGEEVVDFRDLTVSKAIERGMFVLPGDRRTAGLVGDLTVLENVTLVGIERFTRWARIERRRTTAYAHRLIKRYEVVGAVNDRVEVLSGGNQQRVLLAKLLEMQPKVLLCHEPTQGVDVGAQRFVVGLLHAVAARGVGVLVAQADYGDLVRACDRVLVFREGRVAGQVLRGEGAKATVAELSFAS